MKNFFKLTLLATLTVIVLALLCSCGFNLLSSTDQDTLPPPPDSAEPTDTAINMPHTHSWGQWSVKVQPTCTREGEESRSCGHCGDEEIRSLRIIDHTIVTSEGIAPSCTTYGLSDKTHCATCDFVLVDHEPLPPTPHTEVIDEGRAATCKQEGLTEGSHCSSCGKTLTAQQVIPPTSHNEAILPATPASCTEDGLTEGKYCIDCGTVLATQKVIKSSGHSLKLEYAEPTWDTKGGKVTSCLFCSYSVTEYTDAAYRDTLYGYSQFGTLSNASGYQGLYYALYEACETIHNSTINYTSSTDDINIYTSAYGLTVDEAVSVWKIFYIENPKYYWMSNTVGYSSGVICFYVDSLYYSYSVRKQCNEDVQKMITDCSTAVLAAQTEYDKVLAIHNFINNKIEYAYISGTNIPETAQWAHNIIGVASGDKAVCESYAKTFLFLCRVYGIDCIIATGLSRGQGHAWNVVEIDGKWYYVDLTWNDGDRSYYYFGLASYVFSQSHTTDTPVHGINYLYELPTISSF